MAEESPRYDNILNALGKESKLSYQQQADNYNTFSKLMSDGVYLPDLIGRMDALEKKVASMERTSPDVNRELFSVMESAVKDDSGVKEARRRLADVKADIIMEMCLKDPRFKEAWDAYRTAVNAAYIQRSEHRSADREHPEPIIYPRTDEETMSIQEDCPDG